MLRYDYHRPSSLDEAFELAREVPHARFIAGGTDLLVQMRRRRISPFPALISLRAVGELARIEDGEGLRIGAAVPLTDVASHPAVAAGYPALAQGIAVVGSRQIRNVATLGGNLCNASPAADTAPPLLVYDARVELRSAQGLRELPVEELFCGPGRTALRPGEILTAILLPPSPPARSVFLRRGRVKMDLAIASIAIRCVLDGPRLTGVRIAAGAVAPVPLRLRGVETILEGVEADDQVLERVREQARREISPITDLRSSKEYRGHLTGVLAARAVASLASPAPAAAGGVR